jgi:hypothetical protein
MPWWPDRSGGPATMCEKTGPRSNHACRIRHAMGDNIHQVAVSHLHTKQQRLTGTHSVSCFTPRKGASLAKAT